MKFNTHDMEFYQTSWEYRSFWVIILFQSPFASFLCNPVSDGRTSQPSFYIRFLYLYYFFLLIKKTNKRNDSTDLGNRIFWEWAFNSFRKMDGFHKAENKRWINQWRYQNSMRSDRGNAWNIPHTKTTILIWTPSEQFTTTYARDGKSKC